MALLKLSQVPVGDAVLWVSTEARTERAACTLHHHFNELYTLAGGRPGWAEQSNCLFLPANLTCHTSLFTEV